MTRRDTIIVAVLLNTGLLALLLMFSIQTSDEPEIKKIEKSHPVLGAATTVESNTSAPIEILSYNEEGMQQEISIIENADSNVPVEIEKTNSFPFESKVVTEENSKEIADQSSEKVVQITVKKGDSLDKIARANGTTVASIKKLNHLSSEKLSIGQVLKVQVSQKNIEPAKPAKVASQKEPPMVKSEPKYYVIKSGDNPWKIAKQFNVKFEDLLRLNQLDEDRAKNLKVGDKIRVQ